MSERNWNLFLEDIVESIELIEQFIQNMDYKDFTKDRKTIDAVVRNFEIISEASRNLPEDIKEKYPKIDWIGLVGLRNRVIHEYFGISLQIIWTIIKEDLLNLKEQLK